MSFAANMRAALPEGMHLPDPFAQTFDWLEGQCWGGVYTNRDASDFANHYLSIYPPEDRDTYGASFVMFSFTAGPPLHAPPPEVVARVATLGKIAGDGGTLSLWLDDSGAQRIVMFNHGEPFVLTDDPLVALQFLALGYAEPAALGDPNLTPAEAARRDGGDPPVLPSAFRAFLAETFTLTLPARASDLGITIPADGAPDPIRDWLDTAMPEPEALPMPGETPDNPFIITRDLREILGEEGVQSMRDTFKFVVEEE